MCIHMSRRMLCVHDGIFSVLSCHKYPTSTRCIRVRDIYGCIVFEYGGLKLEVFASRSESILPANPRIARTHRTTAYIPDHICVWSHHYNGVRMCLPHVRGVIRAWCFVHFIGFVKWHMNEARIRRIVRSKANGDEYTDARRMLCVYERI